MVLVPFPHHLFAGEEDKRAALVYKACSDAVAFMQHIAKLLLKGSYTDVDEATIKLRETPLKTQHVDQNRREDPTVFPHVVLRFTLRSGEKYALDLSGAQYGFDETVAPWTPYLEKRVRGNNMSNVEIHPCGHMMGILQSHTLGPTLLGVLMRYNIDLTKIALSTCQDFLEKEGFPALSELPKLPEKAFKAKSAALAEHVDKALANFNNQGARFRVHAVDRTGMPMGNLVNGPASIHFY